MEQTIRVYVYGNDGDIDDGFSAAITAEINKVQEVYGRIHALACITDIFRRLEKVEVIGNNATDDELIKSNELFRDYAYTGDNRFFSNTLMFAASCTKWDE